MKELIDKQIQEIDLLHLSTLVSTKGYTGTKELIKQIISKNFIDTIKQTEKELNGFTDFDHSQCPFKEHCIGYQNAVSDINNAFESIYNNIQ